MTLIISLFVIGFLLVIAEVIFIPGTTVVGILGGLMMMAGIYLVYREYGNTTGHFVLLGSIGLNILLLIIGFKIAKSGKIGLQDKLEGRVNVLESKINIGEQGKTFTALRPAGKAIINNERLEVYSLGEYIEENQTVRVIKISDDKIFVKQIS